MISSKSKIWQSLCLALVVSVAPAVGITILMTVAGSLWQEIHSAAVKQNGVRIHTFESQEFDATGRALIRVRSDGQESWLDGKRQPTEAAEYLILPHADLTTLELKAQFRIRSVAEVNGVIPLVYPGELDIDWFLVLADRSTGRACLEGFHRMTAKRAGWIGTNGFVETPLSEDSYFTVDPEVFLRLSHRMLLTAEQVDWKARQFDYPRTTRGQSPLSKHQIVLQARDRLFLIDLAKQTAEELFSGQPVRAVDSTIRPRRVAASETNGAAATGEVLELDPFIVARTADRIVLLSPGADIREEYLLPDEMQGGDFRAYLPMDRSVVLQRFERGQANPAIPAGQYTMHVTELAPDGKNLRSEQIVVVNHHTVDISSRTTLSLAALVVPAPLFSALLPAKLVAQDEATPVASAFSWTLSQIWPTLLAVTLIAMGLAWWSDRRQRALGVGRSLPWLLFVFLLGVPGYLAWLVHRRWPVRNPVPPPKRLGIEVFG